MFFYSIMQYLLYLCAPKTKLKRLRLRKVMNETEKLNSRMNNRLAAVTKEKKPHVARVIKINHKDGTIVYSSKSAPFGRKTVSIDEVKDVWELNKDK